MIKLLKLAVLMTCSSAVFAQNIYFVDMAKNQPLIYRDADGSFKGCGIRTIFMTDVPTQTHVGDISVNIFKAANGRLMGLTKAIYSYAPDMNRIDNVKKIPIDSYMMANASGKAIKLTDIHAGEDANSLVSPSSPTEAVQFMNDLSSGKTVQVGVKLKGDKSLRIFSMKVNQFSIQEAEPFMACLKQVLSN